jgi:dienelactone hydrolase
LIYSALAMAIAAGAQDRYQPVADQQIRGQPYTRYYTTDRFDRKITFYISDGPKTPLPLAVYVHGSGPQPNFVESGGRIHGDNGHNTVADVFHGRARLVIVEKPGAEYMRWSPGSGPPPVKVLDFWREHTLERWSEAVSAAIQAARTLPFIDTKLTLVIGHSEGGLVACKLAADLPFVTHVATLAGGGINQLFDLILLTRAGEIYRYISQDAEERVGQLLADFSDIATDPESPTKVFLGHPYRRWTSFLRSSPLQELSKTKARIYIAQGSEDHAVTPASAEVLRAGLLAIGKKVAFDYVIGGDHNFNTPDSPGAGWSAVMQRVSDWFLPRADSGH